MKGDVGHYKGYSLLIEAQFLANVQIGAALVHFRIQSDEFGRGNATLFRSNAGASITLLYSVLFGTGGSGSGSLRGGGLLGGGSLLCGRLLGGARLLGSSLLLGSGCLLGGGSLLCVGYLLGSGR